MRLRRALRTLLLLCLVGVGVLAATQAAEVVATEIALDRHRLGASITEPVDAAIVLGAGFDPDGRIAWNSRRRVQAAVRLLEAGKADVLILSGNGPRPWFGTVAEMMRDYALDVGVPPEKLIVEPDATTTVQNLIFSFRIADRNGYRRLALVSDAFHLPRSWALAAWMGRPDVELVSVDHRPWTWRPEDAFLNMREALAWWFNLGKVAAWETLSALGYENDELEEMIR